LTTSSRLSISHTPTQLQRKQYVRSTYAYIVISNATHVLRYTYTVHAWITWILAYQAQTLDQVTPGNISRKYIPEIYPANIPRKNTPEIYPGNIPRKYTPEIYPGNILRENVSNLEVEQTKAESTAERHNIKSTGQNPLCHGVRSPTVEKS
jgi:hypothetical protein